MLSWVGPAGSGLCFWLQKQQMLGMESTCSATRLSILSISTLIMQNCCTRDIESTSLPSSFSVYLVLNPVRDFV